MCQSRARLLLARFVPQARSRPQGCCALSGSFAKVASLTRSLVRRCWASPAHRAPLWRSASPANPERSAREAVLSLRHVRRRQASTAGSKAPTTTTCRLVMCQRGTLKLLIDKHLTRKESIRQYALRFILLTWSVCPQQILPRGVGDRRGVVLSHRSHHRALLLRRRHGRQSPVSAATNCATS